jgi:diacylglycerol kinase
MAAYIKTRLLSFQHAFAGLSYVIRTQRNAWIHSVATILVIILAFWLSLPAFQWAILIITIAMVWMAEFINTALEAVVDLASPQKHPLAKVGKDVGAAAVLISAVGAAIIGILILGPPLYTRLLH